MKKIFIFAYINLNLGDDLFVKTLCEKFPQHTFYIVTNKINSIAFNQIQNLNIKIIDEKSNTIIEKLINKFRRIILCLIMAFNSDATINIGGSIFMQKSGGWILKALYYQFLIALSKSFFVIGSNFGPYNNKEYLKCYRKIFSKVDDVCLRDYKSYQLFSDISSVRYAPDVIFSMKTNNLKENKSDDYIVVSVIDLTERDTLSAYKDDYEDSIVKLCNMLIEKNINIKLMSFCRNEGDELAINRITDKVNSCKLTSYFYKGNIQEALEIVNSSSGVVATRFHSLILAWLFKKSVFPIIYSQKTMNVINDLNFKGYCLEISSIDEMNLYKVFKELTTETNFSIDQQIGMSNLNFTGVTDYFNRK